MTGTKHTRRPSTGAITKYEHPLPFHLDEFVTLYLSTEPLADFERFLVDQFQQHILDSIRVHWRESSKTRLLFSNMAQDTVWTNFEDKTMIINARNLATLDPKFLPELENHLLTVERNLIEDMRKRLRAILKAIYASQEEVDFVEKGIAGTEDNNYSIANYGAHLDLIGEMERELKAKFAVIEFARQRELFMMQLVKWEASHKTISQDKAAKGARNINNWIPKFRMNTIKIYRQSCDTLKKLMTDYKQTTNKTFMVLGQDYETMYFVAQLAQVAKVPTNFSMFTADILFFDNPGTTKDGDNIVGRELDPCIEYVIKSEDAVPVLPPPDMPIYAEGVGFLFEYY